MQSAAETIASQDRYHMRLLSIRPGNKHTESQVSTRKLHQAQPQLLRFIQGSSEVLAEACSPQYINPETRVRITLNY